MNKSIAITLSYVFHPLAIPSYLFAVLFFIYPEIVNVSALSESSRLGLLFMIFLYTFAAPALLVYSLIRMKKASSMQLEKLQERRLPLVVTTIIYAAATYYFGYQFEAIAQLAPEIGYLLSAFTIAIGLVALISFTWQISAHATGIAGATGFFFIIALHYSDPIFLRPLVACILLTGWITAARLQLNAHNPAQIIAGIGLGFTICAINAEIFF